MADLGEATVAIRYQLDKLQADFAQVERQVAGHVNQIEGKIKGGFSRLGGIVTAPFRQLSGIASSTQGQIAALGGALGGLAVGRGIIGANVEFERLGAALKTMTGSAAAGREKFNELVTFASKTPSSVAEVVQSFIALKARGLDPSIEALDSFGNTAAALGRPLKQFVEAVADAATGEMERLKEFGIVAEQQGDKVAFTFDNVTTVVGKNSEEITAYLRQIGETKFAGATAEQMNQLPGLFSNLQDVAQSFARSIGEGGLNAGLKDLLRAIIDLQGASQPLAEAFGRLAGPVFSKLADALRNVLGWFNSLSPQMQDFVVKATAIGTSLALVLPPLAILAVSIGAIVSPIGAAIAAIAVAGAAFLVFSDQIDGAVTSVKAVVSDLFEGWDGSFRGLGAIVAKGGVALQNGLNELGDIISNWGDSAKDAILDALSNLDEGLAVTASDLIDGVGNALSAAGAGLGSIGEGIFSSIIDAAQTVLGGLPAIATKVSTDFSASFATGIGSALGAVVTTIGTYATTFASNIAELAVGMVTSWQNNLSAESFTGRVREAVAGIGPAIQTGLAGLGNFALEFAIGFAGQLGIGLTTNLTAISPSLVTSVTNLLGVISTTLNNGIAGLVGTATSVFGVVVSAGQTALAPLANVSATISRQFGDNFAAGLGAALGGVAGTIGTFAVTFQTKIRDLAVGLLTTWNVNLDSGDWSSAIKAVLSAIGQALAGLANLYGRYVLEFASGFSAGLQSALGVDVVASAKAGVARIRTAIANGLEGLRAIAVDAIKRMVDGIKAEITGRFTSVMESIQAPVEKVKAFFEGLQQAVVGGSSFPDMIDGIAYHTSRLDGEMVQPIQSKLTAIRGSFSQTAIDAQASMDAMAESAKQATKAMGDDPAKKFGWKTFKPGEDALPKKGAAGGGADVKQRQQRINDIKTEIAELQRLGTAQNVSVEEYRRVAEQIAGEKAARELGLDVKSKEGQAIAALTVEQMRLADTLQRKEAITGLEAEVAGLQRLNVAALEGAAAREQVRVALLAEAAAQQLVGRATEEEIARVKMAVTEREKLLAAGSREDQLESLRVEVGEQERLAAAQAVSQQAYEATAIAIAKEQAVRELGIGATTAQIAEVEKLTEAQFRLANVDPSARRERIEDLEIETDQNRRLIEAQRHGAAAYEATALAIEQEIIVREIGLGATDEEIAKLKELIRIKREQGNLRVQTDEFGAGVNAALEEYVDRAREHGRIAGEFIREGLGVAEDGLAQFLKTGKFTFDDLSEAAGKLKDRLIDIASEQIIANLVAAMLGPRQPGAAGGVSATLGAKGGIFSGPGIGAFSGRIVSKPTVFPFASGIGLIGEAGPEAVLPLKRGRGGRLGVELAAHDSGAATTNVQIIDQRGRGAPPVEVQRGDGMQGVRVLIRSENRRNTAGGDMDRQMGGRFGLAPSLKY